GLACDCPAQVTPRTTDSLLYVGAPCVANNNCNLTSPAGVFYGAGNGVCEDVLYQAAIQGLTPSWQYQQIGATVNLYQQYLATYNLSAQWTLVNQSFLVLWNDSIAVYPN